MLYNSTAAASCTDSGASAGDTPTYSAGATESQVACKNWYLPAAPELGLIAVISPPDSRWAIACKWEFTFTDEPLVASLELSLFEEVDSCCGCWVSSVCGAVVCCGCSACSLCSVEVACFAGADYSVSWVDWALVSAVPWP